MIIRLILILLTFGLVACSNSGPQSERIVIEDADYDFGLVPDTVQVLKHQFKIENVSSDTCRIKKIEKSCGCTKVYPSGNVIAPDAYITLDVEVDLGSNYSFFERDINIYMEHQPEPYTIFVRASRQVPKDLVEKMFPVRISDQLRANMPFLILSYLPHGEVKTHFLNVNNSSDKAVKYTAQLIGAPSYVSIFHDDQIAANDVGRVIITTDLTNVKDEWGVLRYTLRLTSGNDSTDIPVEGILIDPPTTSEKHARIMMPIIAYSIDPSKKDYAKFVIRNVGEETLHIRDLKVAQGTAKKITIGSHEIASQQKDTISVYLEPNQRENVIVGISTNDPIEPYKEIRVICEPSKTNK